MVKASFFQCLITASLKNTNTMQHHKFMSPDSHDSYSYSLAGWSHSLVVLHKQTTLTLLQRIKSDIHPVLLKPHYLTMLLLRSLLFAHNFQIFMHMFVALTVFCYCFFGKLLYFITRNFQ